MKKLLFSLLLALMPALLNAQSQSPPRHALRVGAGINISAAYDNFLNTTGDASLGAIIVMDYQYVLSKYFDLNVSFAFLENDYAPQALSNSYSVSLRGILTPLPNIFSYIQIGAGLAYEYEKTNFAYSEVDNNLSIFLFCRNESHLLGVDIPLRLYVIDNNKYQLFLDYTLNYRFEPQYNWEYFLYSTTSINFGIKF